jgi:hypothetical protein
VPAGLVVVGVLLVAVVIVAMRSDLEKAGDGDSIGPSETGVSVRLVEGYRYQIYRESGPAPKGKAACRLGAKAGASGTPLTLGDASKGHRDERVTSNGQEYVFLGDFAAPSSGQTTVSCPGQSDTMLVRPDDKPFLMLALAIIVSLALAAIALIVFVVLLVLRRRRSRAGQQLMGYPPY